MSGVLIPVVGPSGAGKDTLIDVARTKRPDIYFPKRMITRPETAVGEDFSGVTPPEFEQICNNGGFAFHWQAHGLSYGIPADIEDALEAGRSVIFNGSRGIVNEARKRYSNVLVIVVTAPIETLAERLAQRGRESVDDIANRLKRADYAMPKGDDVCVIDNSSPLEQSAAALLAALPAMRPEDIV